MVSRTLRSRPRRRPRHFQIRTNSINIYCRFKIRLRSIWKHQNNALDSRNTTAHPARRGYPIEPTRRTPRFNPALQSRRVPGSANDRCFLAIPTRQPRVWLPARTCADGAIRPNSALRVNPTPANSTRLGVSQQVARRVFRIKAAGVDVTGARSCRRLGQAQQARSCAWSRAASARPDVSGMRARREVRGWVGKGERDAQGLAGAQKSPLRTLAGDCAHDTRHNTARARQGRTTRRLGISASRVPRVDSVKCSAGCVNAPPARFDLSLVRDRNHTAWFVHDRIGGAALRVAGSWTRRSPCVVRSGLGGNQRE
ncbi:hypothetical protein C8R43DRAFT_704811 [Mycena crocata]|nr:hypothetical protein C8R43DRAFT_704811 [Mycena crocata]